ncbi:PIN domain-containing protein [Humibacter ginsengisoli]
MSDSQRAFFDTNVLVYAYGDTDDDRHRRAVELFEVAIRTRSAVVSTQVLLEFYVTLTRKISNPAPLSAGAARERLQLLSRGPVHSPLPEDVVAAVAIAEESQVSVWDAMIIRSASRMQCPVLWTEDLNHGQVIAGVEIRNPFR